MSAEHPSESRAGHGDPGDGAMRDGASGTAPRRSRFAWMNWPLATLIRAYRLTLSPVMGMHCRFVPTCSQYGLDACSWHSPPVAVWLIARRVLSCRPGGRAGYDPVPLPDGHGRIERGHRCGCGGGAGSPGNEVVPGGPPSGDAAS